MITDLIDVIIKEITRPVGDWKRTAKSLERHSFGHRK